MAPDERPGDPSEGENEAPTGLTETVVRGVSLAGSGYALSQALTLLAYLALARLATPEDFGIYAAAGVVIAFGLLVTESGMLAALIHRRERIEEAANTAVISTIVGGLLLGGVVVAVSPLMGMLFKNDTVTPVTAALAGTLTLRNATIVPDALLERRFSFVRRTVIEPIAVVAFAAGAIIATSEGMGVWGLVIGEYASAAVTLVLAWGLARWRPRPGLASFAMWRELIGYGRHVITAGLVLRVGEQADRVLVGRFLGEGSLGQYTYAFRIAATPYWAMLAGASHVLFPAFARISDDPQRFRPAFARAARWVLALGLPLGFLMLPLGEPAAVILFGEVWRPAGEVATAMFLFAGASSLASVCLEAVKAWGRPDLLLGVNLAAVGATVALVGAAVPVALWAVGVAVTIGAVVSALMSLRAFRIATGMPASLASRAVWAPLVASAAMALALLALDRLLLDAGSRDTLPGLLILCGEAALGALLYGLTLGAISAAARRRGVELLRTGIEMVRPRAEAS
jgi:PST family polysaccharide transporter